MINDKTLLFSEAQDLSQVAGTYVSTNSYDLGNGVSKGAVATYDDVFKGETLRLFAKVVEAFVGAGASVQVQVITADAADLTGNVTVLTSGPLIAVATLIAGYEYPVPVPQGVVGMRRYLGVQFVISGATTTAGTMTAGITFGE